MKKQIYLDGELTPFWIYSNGMLFREDTGNWYKPFPNCGYLSYHLKWKGKTYPRRIHRLVAEYFIPNPENKPCVHHIDGDRLNNSIENLAWATAAENAQHKKPRTSQPRVVIQVDNTEEWKQYNDTEFYVSNFGRVKNIRTKNILKGNVRENGYLRYGLRYNGKIHSFNAHNLVWLVWKGKQKGVIDHINGDKLDNRLSNLQDISQSENQLKANRKGKFIGNSLEKDGPIISIYKSQAAAARTVGTATGTLNHALHRGWKCGGYYWRFLDEKDYV